VDTKIYLTVFFFLFPSCNNPEYDSPCTFDKSSFQKVYLLKQFTNDTSSFCGIENKKVNSSSYTGANSSSISISYTGSPYTITALNSVGSILPQVVGTFTSYSISPSLPAGLNFNPSTGEITGTPSFLISSGNYTVTAISSLGTQTANLTLNIILPGKRIFLSGNGILGNWATTSAADNFCNSDPAKPLGPGIYKAMIGFVSRKACNNGGGCVGFSAEAIDWVLFAGIKYYRPDGTFIAQATNDRIFTFPLTNPISNISTNVWTGIDLGWNTTAASTAECTGWTSAGFGNYGNSNATTNSILYVSNSVCGSSYRLYCVEQ